MTYNTHSCIGLDGRSRPRRVARVIEAFRPDIVALQEIDFNRTRTGRQDQASMIAEALGMRVHFLPLVTGGCGEYGIAVLSRFPFQLVQAGHLTPGRARRIEARGAIWIRIERDGRPLHVINTHFGLTRAERLNQVGVLLGPNWLGGLPDDPPLVVCGDFNAGPRSTVYRLMNRRFRDAQLAAPGHLPRSTFLSICPFARIDHIFISSHFAVQKARVAALPSARIASDHLPLIAHLGVPPQPAEAKHDPQTECAG